jgi:hypothetical protein
MDEEQLYAIMKIIRVKLETLPNEADDLVSMLITSDRLAALSQRKSAKLK